MTLSNRVAIQQEFTKLNHRIQALKFSMVIDDLIHQANEGSVQHMYLIHCLSIYVVSIYNPFLEVVRDLRRQSKFKII